MKHSEIVEIAERLINVNQRETAKTELTHIITGNQIPEIEKVQILSVTEMHLLSKCNLIIGSKEILLFICSLKKEIKTPHLAQFINEYMSISKGKFKCNKYVERKIAETDFHTDVPNSGKTTTLNAVTAAYSL